LMVAGRCDPATAAWNNLASGYESARLLTLRPSPPSNREQLGRCFCLNAADPKRIRRRRREPPQSGCAQLGTARF